jgi:hypothetical protein
VFFQALLFTIGTKRDGDRHTGNIKQTKDDNASVLKSQGIYIYVNIIQYNIICTTK